MNALTEVFVFIHLLSIGVALQGPEHISRARHPGHKKLVRKETVLIDAASGVQHIKSVVSKVQHSRRSSLLGKIEQGGLCLAAKLASQEHEDHELEMLVCDDSADLGDEDWEADSEGVPGQIKLAETEIHDMELCLEADSSYDLVDLKICSTDPNTSTHQQQMFTYDNMTYDIKIQAGSETKCLTAHDHDSDGDLELKLEDCTFPLESRQEFVFEQSHHTLPVVSSTHYGKIEHNATSKCIAAHRTSTDALDLEVVACAGDGDDDEEWEADAAIHSSHDLHAPQQIKLQDTADGLLCLTADSALEEVELKHCHTHTHHHRQMWVYEDDEIKIEDPATAVVKCMASEPETDNGAEGPDVKLILEDCTGSPDQQWEWEQSD